MILPTIMREREREREREISLNFGTHHFFRLLYYILDFFYAQILRFVRLFLNSQMCFQSLSPLIINNVINSKPTKICLNYQ